MSLYRSKRWKVTRQRILLRDRNTCQMPGCSCFLVHPSRSAPVEDISIAANDD